MIKGIQSKLFVCLIVMMLFSAAHTHAENVEVSAKEHCQICLFSFATVSDSNLTALVGGVFYSYDLTIIKSFHESLSYSQINASRAPPT